MKLDWLCAEKATAVSLGCAGLMLADGGLITGGVIAGAGLLSLWSKARRADGVNSEKLLADARARLLKDLSGWAEGRDLVEADVIAADKAMADHLADCVPPVAELAKATFHAEEFPAHAALLVVERLAEKNPIFSATHPSRSPAAREFALLVMTSALTMAKEQPEFLQRLTQEIVLLLPQHLVGISAKIDDLGAAQAAETARSAAADAEQKAALAAILARLDREAVPTGVPESTVIEIARRVSTLVTDLDGAITQIHAAIDELILLRDRAARGSNLGELVDEALRRIAERNARNAFDEGAAAGEDAYGELMQRQKAERIALADAMIAQSRVRVDAAALARWEEERQRIETPDLTARGLFDRIEGFLEAGQNRGEPLALDVAILLAERAVSLARSTWETGASQNLLGRAATNKGEYSDGSAGMEFLARAAGAYQAAIEVADRTEMRANWAMTQNNLGLALTRQGERSGGEAGLELLARAVTAFEAAVEEQTLAERPSDCAMTQNNLGIALAVQGERSGGAAGLDLLARAVAACESALEVYTRADMPARWAMVQNNLGNALQAQGSRSGGAAGLDLLARAVVAYESALEVHTSADMPADWAMTQNNLGIALAARGKRSGGAAGLDLLARAVAAYEAALEVRTRADMPAQWAMTQDNIALAEESRGDLSTGAAQAYHWRDAEAAALSALEVYDPDNMGYYHDKATHILARIRAKLAGGD